MIGFTAKVTDETAKVKQAVDRTAYRNLGHAAASIRKAAIRLIRRSAKPSAEGEPPHTREGALRRSIRFAVEDKFTAVIGPRASAVGQSASAHEHGGMYMGQEFSARPFMGPAMEENLDRFAKDWEGAVG